MAISTLKKNQATATDGSEESRIKPTDRENEISEIRADGNTASRIEEEVCISATAAAIIPLSILYNSDSKEADIAVNVIGSFVGTMLGVGAAGAWYHYRDTKWLKGTKIPLKTQPPIPNPWARRFKTSFFIGQKVGELVGLVLFSWLGLPILNLVKNALVKICGALFALLFGVIGMLCLSGGKSLKSIPLTRFGRDGWTKYTKTGFVYGNAVGLFTVCILCLTVCPITSFPTLLIVGSAVGSLVGAAVISLAVPIYHWYKLRRQKNSTTPHRPDDKKKKTPDPEYRTNYARAGIVLGGFIGTILAGIVAGLFFPPALFPILITLGGAVGTLILGIVLGYYGPAIERKIENGVKTANSFDYAIRTGAMFGNNYGLGQVLSKTPGIFGFVATSIFGLVFSIGSLIREVFHVRKFKKSIEEDVKKIDALTGNDLKLKKEALKLAKDERTQIDYVLPWTQRAATGVMVGFAVFAFIGFCINPFCSFIFGGVGGMLGALVACRAENYFKNKGYIPTEKVKIADKIEHLIQKENKNTPTPIIPAKPIKTSTSSQHFSRKQLPLFFNPASQLKNKINPERISSYISNHPILFSSKTKNKTPHSYKAPLKKPYENDALSMRQELRI